MSLSNTNFFLKYFFSKVRFIQCWSHAKWYTQCWRHAKWCFWPRENTPNGDHHFVCFRVAKITIWRVFAWRPFAPPGTYTTNRGENAKGRHAKTRQMMTFSCYRMATFRPATRKYATVHALRFRLLFVVSLPGEAKGRHAKTRQMVILATRKHTKWWFWRVFATLSPRQAQIRQTGAKTRGMKCRTFVWRGERSPCENMKRSPFGGFSRGAFSPFRPENTIIRHGTNQPPYVDR